MAEQTSDFVTFNNAVSMQEAIRSLIQKILMEEIQDNHGGIKPGSEQANN